MGLETYRRKGNFRHTPESRGETSRKRGNRSASQKFAAQDLKTGDKNTVAGIELTNPDRVLYPEQGITKLELALFYEEIADWILPHLSGRPLTLVRCPEGHQKECFYQRHPSETLHDAIQRLLIREKKTTKTYVAVNSLPGLIALVQMGVLEIHTWGSRSDRLERPDRLIFDLDPDPSLPWTRVIEGAHPLRERLTDLGLGVFLKTTGGKGLHAVVPLVPEYDWDHAREFSKAVAESIVRDAPDRYTAVMSKAKRKGKLFIDYLRNAWAATAVAAYSTRARSRGSCVSPVALGGGRPRASLGSIQRPQSAAAVGAAENGSLERL